MAPQPFSIDVLKIQMLNSIPISILGTLAARRHRMNERGGDTPTGKALAMSARNERINIESREDAGLARRMMAFAAANQTSRTKRCDRDALHMSLSWHPDELPTREQMEEAQGPAPPLPYGIHPPERSAAYAAQLSRELTLPKWNAGLSGQD
jgi:hypothetical protein